MKRFLVTLILIISLSVPASMRDVEGFSMGSMKVEGVTYRMVVFPDRYLTSTVQFQEGIRISMVIEFGCRSFNQCRPVFEDVMTSLRGLGNVPCKVLYLPDSTAYIFPLIKNGKLVGVFFLVGGVDDESD